MDSQTRMLVWKEFRERQTQFILCLLWMVAGTIYCIAYEWSKGFRAPVASFFSIASLYALPMPIFLAMRTSLGETTDHTRSFSDGLPVSSRTRGAVRLLGGVGALVAPLIVGAILLSVFLAVGGLEQAPSRALGHDGYIQLPARESLIAQSAVGLLWCVVTVVALSGTGLYLLLALLGTKLRAESHLGYCGALIAVLWFLGMALGPSLFEMGFPQISAWSGAITPQAIITNYSYGHERGSYGDLAFSSAVWVPLSVNVFLQLVCVALFVRAYSRKSSSCAIERAEKTAQRAWWTPPLPTPGIALAWLALRQSAAMCLPGLALALVMTPVQMEAQLDHPRAHLVGRYTDALPSAMWVIGLLWSVVVGAGIFSSEIDSRIGEFWRTRPIPAWRLFGIKFAVGMLAVLLVLDGTVIAATWSSPNWGDYYCINWPYIACFLPLHATMYAIAVAWTCVLRRAVFGGMAAIGTFSLLSVVLEWSSATRDFNPIEVYNHLGSSLRAGDSADFSAHYYPAVVTTMGVILVASSLIGWWGLRRYAPIGKLVET
jgi:hypothetical protein